MIRNVKLEDAKDIMNIYNEYVLHSNITFETTPVSEKEMEERIYNLSLKYPYWVAEEDGKVIGYCYAHNWKERMAYRYTLETTVYIAPDAKGKGLGERLMRKLISECHQKGYHSLIACITEGNEISNKLHLKLGFKQVSHFKEVGKKFGCWLDVNDFELILSK